MVDSSSVVLHGSEPRKQGGKEVRPSDRQTPNPRKEKPDKRRLR
jgi:hypothetical protein